MSERRVLITGAAGYVGRLVTRQLAANRAGIAAVVATDVREVPAPERLEGIDYLVADVRAPDLAQVLSRHRINTVVHLASIVTPGPGCTPEIHYQVDVLGTRNVLAACVAAGVDQIVVTSSGAAYGYHPDAPAELSEDDALRGNDQFPYARHKRLVEEMLADFRRCHPELRQLVLRLCTVIGESTSNQITALFEKRVVVGFRGATTRFSFIWDGDVAACVVAGVRSEADGVFNLAGDGSVPLREIARRLGKPFIAVPVPLVRAALGVLQRLGLTRYGPEQIGFLRYRPVLANERLKRQLGFVPRYTSTEAFEVYRGGRRRRPDRLRSPVGHRYDESDPT